MNPNDPALQVLIDRMESARAAGITFIETSRITPSVPSEPASSRETS